MNSRLFLLFILVLAHPIDAQHFKGVVKDSLSNPIENAIVLLKQETKIIAHATTDNAGHFAFTGTTFPLTISIAALGYEGKTIRLDSLPRVPVEVTMSSKPFVLKESVIVSKAAVKQTKDTLTFRANAYKDSTERTLEQLLTKIPGISVEPDGTITALGQPVRKILIEGDDMTGRNYQVLSKNLTADIVNEIQIISKFNDNKQLMGIQQSDDKVLNIKIKNTKSLLFGKIEAGIGTDARTSNNINLLLFKKKIKSLNFGSFNNVGEPPASGRQDNENFRNTSASTKPVILLSDAPNTFIKPDRGSYNSLGNQNVNFNQAVMGSSHFLYRPNEKTVFKGNISISNDHRKEFTDRTTNYQTLDTSFTLSEQQVYITSPTILDGSFLFNRDVGPRSTLSINSSLRKTKTTGQELTVFNQTNQIQTNLKNTLIYFNTNVDWSSRLNDQVALNITANFSQDDNPQSISFKQSTERTISTLQIPTLAVNQTINTGQYLSYLTGQFFLSKPKHYLNANVHITNRVERLASQWNDSFADSTVTSGELFHNNFNLNRTIKQVELKYSYVVHHFKLISEWTPGLHSISKIYASNTMQPDRTSSYLWLGTLGIRYENLQST